MMEDNMCSISILVEKSNISRGIGKKCREVDFRSNISILPSMIRIWFFGTPYLARRVLEDIVSSWGFEVAFAVTNPPKPIGRSGELQPTSVSQFATAEWIPVLTPTKIRDNREFFDTLRDYGCDYFIVVAYGRILPLELLEIPKKICINVHGSILPKYRWASPIQSALLHGEKETGVTIMEMSEGMDEGDILKIRTIHIADDETSETLFAKFADISGKALVDTIRELETWGITPLPQDDTQATYCKKIEKEDGHIDWNQYAREVYQRWQAYTPWPGIYTIYEGKRLLLEKVGDWKWKIENGNPGTVVRMENGEVGVICWEGVLIVKQVKLEWKKSQSISDFVNWHIWFIGYKLSHVI